MTRKIQQKSNLVTPVVARLLVEEIAYFLQGLERRSGSWHAHSMSGLRSVVSGLRDHLHGSPAGQSRAVGEA